MTAAAESVLGELGPEILVAPPGPRSRVLSQEASRAECPAFEERRQARSSASGEDHGPVVYRAAHGSNVVDVDGNRYVDLVAGFGACVLGHAPAAVVVRATEALARLPLALGDVYPAEDKVTLLGELAALFAPRSARVILGTSGADAVTAALKTAVLRTGRRRVVAFEGSYHGLSYAPLAACGLAPSFREPFAPQLGGFVDFVAYPTDENTALAVLAKVEALFALREHSAVLVEPILGRGGCVVPAESFLVRLRALCTQYEVLFVADEIWTGLGRAGALVTSLELEPDLVCLGKGLGGGLPISACIGTEDAMRGWAGHGGTVLHTATHFGSPPACAAALATLAELRERDLPARSLVVGERFRAALKAALGSRVRQVRGRGLMVGVVFADARAALLATRRLLAKGYLVLTGGTEGNVLTLTPALDVPESLLEGFVVALAEIV